MEILLCKDKIKIIKNEEIKFVKNGLKTFEKFTLEIN